MTPCPITLFQKQYKLTQATINSMLPPDPCYFRSSGSSQILKFYSYGPQILARHDVYLSLRAANKEASTFPPDTLMGPRERQYSCADVRLLLQPGPSMTWGMWKDAIRGVVEFITYYQFLDMDFNITQARVVGTGVLTSFE